MEQKKTILGFGRRSAIAIFIVAIALSYASSIIVETAMDNRYDDGYEKGAQQVFNVMIQSAAPACSILTVSDETLGIPIRYIDMECITEA